jgi:hypothetical protein
MLHLPQQRSKPQRLTDDMQQAKLRKRLAGLSLLLVLGLLGMAAVLGITRPSRGHRTVGLMPETVCTAARANTVVSEIVIRAPRPDHLVGTVARWSGFNK